jgi:hypothetical protein
MRWKNARMSQNASTQKGMSSNYLRRSISSSGAFHFNLNVYRYLKEFPAIARNIADPANDPIAQAKRAMVQLGQMRLTEIQICRR